MTLRNGWMAVAALAATLLWANAARAQDNKEDKATDLKIAGSLKEVINIGADRFNKQQDYWGCYRLYEGALLTSRAFLGHRAGLQKDIDAAFAEADKTPAVHDKAYVLRRVMDKIRAECDPSVKLPQPKTLWERLGGEPNVKKVVDDFVATAAPDPKVDFFRGGKYKLDAKGVENLKKQLVEQISSLTGGPYQYKGKSMKDAHKGMGITDAQFDALAGHLKAALEKNGAKPEDVKTILDAVGKTKAEIVEPKKPETPSTPETKKLWDRLGGEMAVKKVVDDFVAAAAVDKKVDFFRGGKVKLDDKGVAMLKTKLVGFISVAADGPLKYDGKTMKDSHKGMEITSEQFDALAAVLADTLKKNGVKKEDADELLAKVAKTKPDIVEKK